MSRPDAASASVQEAPAASVQATEERARSAPVSRVSRNVIYNLMGQLTLLALGFVSARFIFRGLGEDAFGLILFATGLSATITGLLELGLIATTVRAVAIHSDDARYLAEYVRTSSSLYWVLYALLACAAFILAPAIVRDWIHLRNLSSTEAENVVRLLMVASLSALPRNLYASLFRGLQRMEFNNGIEVMVSAVQQAGIVGILLLGGGLLTVSSWMLIVSGLALSVYIASLCRFLPSAALLPGYSQRVVAQHWKFAAKLSGNQMLFTVFIQSDKLIVSKLLALSSFGYYSFAWSSIWRVAAVSTVVNQAVLPSMAALAGSGAVGRLGEQYRKSHDIVCHAWVVPMAAAAFGGWPIFRFLFGGTVARSLLVPVLLLSLAYYMHATLTVPMAVAAASGRPEFITRVNLFALFTFLPVLTYLVFTLGLTGAGLAWLGYYALSYAVLIPPVCKHCLGFPAIAWYRDMARIFLALICTYGLAWSICFVAYRESTLAWVAGFAVATVLFGALTFPVVLGSLRTERAADQSPS